MEIYQKIPSRRGLIALGITAATLALCAYKEHPVLGGESASAGTVKLEKKRPETLAEFTIEELTKIHKKIDLLRKQPIKAYFSINIDNFELNGQMMTQRVVSFGDTKPGTFEKTYTHIIEEYPATSNLPSSIAVVLGANEPMLDSNTEYEYLTILNRHGSDKDRLSLNHYRYFPDSKLQPIVTRYNINPPRYLIYKSPKNSQVVSRFYMSNIINNFTSEVDGLLDYVLTKNEKQNPLVA